MKLKIKHVSLCALTIHSAMLGLSMRYSRTRSGDMFLASTAVFMSEVVKLLICLFLVFNEERRSFSRFIIVLKTQIIDQPWDTLKVCIPSLLFIIQNNLLYTSASNLSAATYQVTYQFKIPTTALFSVLIFKRKIVFTQWIALFILLLGIVLVQLEDAKLDSKNHKEQNRLLGVLSALLACILSSYAGVFLEKILKESNITIWMRNLQLSFLSIPLSLLSIIISNYSFIIQNGFFYGYNGFLIYLILLQSAGGLLVAMVVKHADNIQKGFATALAIVIISIASINLFDFKLTIQFFLGAMLVILSIFLYNYSAANSFTRFERNPLLSII